MCTWLKRLMNFAFHINPVILLAALAAGLIFSAIPIQPVHAGVLTVTTINDGETGSLRQAISRAMSGDTIVFDPSLQGQTITLTKGALIIQKRVTISGPGAEALTISGNNKYRIFLIDARAVVTISGITLANGYVRNQRGAGIYNIGNLTLDHTIIRDNVLDSLSFGGVGIYNGGTLNVISSTVRNNADRTYSLGGGGIYNDKNLTVQDSVITGNQVHSLVFLGVYGGGGICNRGTATITNTLVSDNIATKYTSGGGGGIYNSGSLTIAHSQVTGNQANQTFGGGLINWTSGTVQVDTSQFINNQTGGDGGAIENTGHMTITNSTIAYNHANSSSYGGGGIDNSEGTLTLVNSTLAGNETLLNGGGLLNYDGTVDLIFTTLSGNSAVEGGGIYTTGDAAVTTTSLTNTILAANTGGDCANSGAFNVTTSLIADGSCGPTFSGDPLLGPLQNNGGENETLLPLPGSPVIDQGICTDLSIDQRGLPRLFDFVEIPNWEGGAGCDLGAVEAQP